jgi:hypothetical protein
MRQVHAYGRGLAQDGEQRIARKKLTPKAQRIVVSVTGSKHPLVAAHVAYAATDLVGERLEAKRVVAGASALDMAALAPCSASAARKISMASSKRRFSRLSKPANGISDGVAAEESCGM